jgi:hypothetical protein
MPKAARPTRNLHKIHRVGRFLITSSFTEELV